MNKVFNSLIWRFLERVGFQGVKFIISIILARLLAPEIYGTVALVTVFTSILQVFIDSGMGLALVQKKNADDLDYSSLFFFNLGMCIVLYIGLFFAAPFIATFYERPELVSIIRVMGITLLVAGVNSIQNAYISRNLLFKKTFFSTLGGTVFSAVVGVVMAYAGYGVWALVIQTVLDVIVRTGIIWITVRWRPKLLFSLQRLKGLFSFGWKMLVSTLIDTVYNELYSLIIGKKYSSNDLAFYNKGKLFPNMIVTNVNYSINSVLLPTMAKEQDNSLRVKAMTRRAIRTSTYIMSPLMIGLAVCAEPLVTVLLTEKWLPCVLFLRLFCVSYIFYPIHTANLSAIQALGRSDLFLKLEIIKKIIGVALVLGSMWISVEAMAYSLLVSALLSTIINAYPNKKLLGYSWTEQMKDILPNILLAAGMGVPVFLMQWLPLPQIVILILQVLVGSGVYVGFSVIFKLEIYQYLLQILKGYLGKRKKV